MRTRRQVNKFKADNPERFYVLANKIIADLTEFEKAVSELT